MRHVVIIGLGPGAEEAPRDQELWGLAWCKDYGLQRYFEIHDPWLYDASEKAFYPDGVENLNDLGAPVYMAKREDGVELCVEYPIDDITNEFGRYLESSIAYALALAIYERVEKISIYGVSGDDEYATQRPNLEYLIGYGRGLGLDITVHGDSKLLTSEHKNGLYC